MAIMKPGDELRNLVLQRTGLKEDELHCPRERSFMTPCVARDGDCAATGNGQCVGCGHKVNDLLTAERAKVMPLKNPPTEHGREARALAAQQKHDEYIYGLIVELTRCNLNFEKSKAILTTALQAAQAATWDKAIKAGVDEAYALAPRHDGTTQLAVRMILEAIRGAKLKDQAQAHQVEAREP